MQLAQQLQLSQEQSELVCKANPDAVLELSADGHLITMTPTGSETSARNSTLVVLLGLALGANRLRDGSVLGPDLVVELANPSDEGPRGVTALRQKMELYRRNGARLGWLLLPAAAPRTGHHAGCRRALAWSADRPGN